MGSTTLRYCGALNGFTLVMKGMYNDPWRVPYTVETGLDNIQTVRRMLVSGATQTT